MYLQLEVPIEPEEQKMLVVWTLRMMGDREPPPFLGMETLELVLHSILLIPDFLF